MRRRASLPLTVSAVLVALAAGACSGAPETGTGGEAGSSSTSHTGAIEMSELCAVFVDDVCAALMQCGASGYCDLDHCRAEQECRGMAALEAEVDAGWVVYDAVAAGECHDKFAADPCEFGFFITIPTVQQVLLQCPGVLTPKQSAGDDCASLADCTEDTMCVDDSGCPGKCTPWLTEGEPCVIGMGPRCDPRIDLECRDGVCKTEWAVGDPCSVAADCFPYWCDMMAGTCKPAAKEGEACDNFSQGAPRCDEDLWCDSQFEVGVCQPLSGAGGPCFQDMHCKDPLTCLPDTGFPNPGVCDDLQPVGGKCDSFDDCASGVCDTDTCVPPGAEGEPCAPGSSCEEGLTCDQNVCRPWRCPGEKCGDAEGPCLESVCQAGVCETHASLGEACVDDDDCASGGCASGTCVDPKSCVP